MRQTEEEERGEKKFLLISRSEVLKDSIIVAKIVPSFF